MPFFHMNIIFNASFLIPRNREVELVAFLRREIALIEAPEAQLSVMRESGGVDYRQAEAQSVAFQTVHPSLEAAREWGSSVFPQLAARFEENFAPEGMVFVSLFQKIKL